MSISTLRRQPALAIESLPSAAVAEADPLAATVDSGRRERTSIRPPPETTLRTASRYRRWIWIPVGLAIVAAGVVAVVVLAPGGDGGTSAAQAPPPVATPVATPETAEDVRKLAAQAIGEEIIAAQQDEPADDEDVDEADEADEDVMIPPPPTAPPPAAKKTEKTEKTPAASLGGASGLRPTDGDDGETTGSGGDGLRTDLVAAEGALEEGDYREALYLAERAERDGAGAHALSVMARAHCAMDNVGNAAAALRRIPARRTLLRRQVRVFCLAHGHQLEE